MNARQAQKIDDFISQATKDGAELVSGGKAIDGPGSFIHPTVLANVNQGMEIVREEVFGPVLVCQSFDEVDEVTDFANDSKYGLAASIWTESLSHAHRLAERVRAGTVWINCHLMYDASLPIGGMKQSGWGRDSGFQAMDNYLEEKTVCAVI